MTAALDLLSLYDTHRADAPPVRTAIADAARHAWSIELADATSITALLDVDERFEARCLMLRIAGRDAPVALRLGDCVAIAAAAAGGWLLARRPGGGRAFWLPRAPVLRWLDEQRRIRREEAADVAALALDGQAGGLTLHVPAGATLDCVLWDLPATLADELLSLDTPEGQGLFLWGSHTVYRRPADLWRHLVHGHVYEDRYEWPLRRKTPSENDAHALGVCMGGLAHATGKRIYTLLARHLLLAVLDRQDADGGFRHGEWTEAREAHFRLHASAMHLMMDALSAAPDPAVRTALERAMAYATQQRDRTALGDWFLHDELELSKAGMDAGPFRWFPSTACGKSPTNMLVLNTHLDTLVALIRYRELTSDRQYDALIDSARAAAVGVLALRPMEALYGLLFRLFALTFLPTRRAAALPLPQRVLKRIAWRYLLPWLPRLKARWPRLVMPGGYVDRDLSLRTWSHRYLTVNAMDLARIARREPDSAPYREVLGEALRFTARSGIAEKWREKEADRYSLGFLVEALYQTCTLDAAWPWRTQLAQAILACCDLDLGLSPSIFGHNCEIDTATGDYARAADPRLRVIAIHGRDVDEVLVINPDTEAVELDWARAPSAALVWRDADGRPISRDVLLPPRGWRIGALP
ncbi:MAG TPA: hypothetical protein PJ986_05010 [Gammaproteobacteria bacterium]|nr:hypothetical protein [Gammaproteobacteria bacterium]